MMPIGINERRPCNPAPTEFRGPSITSGIGVIEAEHTSLFATPIGFCIISLTIRTPQQLETSR
jgi:hypothetical protein